jgi:hypothetical protein
LSRADVAGRFIDSAVKELVKSGFLKLENGQKKPDDVDQQPVEHQ